jgi:dihydrofolate reductase
LPESVNDLLVMGSSRIVDSVTKHDLVDQFRLMIDDED